MEQKAEKIDIEEASGGYSSEKDPNTKLCCNDRCHKNCGIYVCRSRSDTCLTCFVICLILSLLVTFVLPPVLEKLLQDGIAEQVVMTPDNPNLATWESNIGNNGGADPTRRKLATLYESDDVSTDGGEVHYDTYFFNVTNPDDVLNGAKPHVECKGPYAHDEYFQKFDVSWDDNEEEVTYNTYKYYLYNQANSGPGLSDEDELTLIYPTVIGFQFIIDQLPESAESLLSTAIRAELLKEYEAIESSLKSLEDAIDKKHIGRRMKEKLDAQVDEIQKSFTRLFYEIDEWVATVDNPTDLLLKLILGKSPMGISPFFKVKPGPGYFGWLNDPVLMEVQVILDLVTAKTNVTIPWSSAVPGSVNNYTSIADARRRSGKTTMNTGKKTLSDAGQTILYEGMNTIHGCISPMSSQDPDAYVEGKEFPACELYDLSWNESVAESKGYALAWATDAANAVIGNTGEIFGPGLNKDLTRVFIGDIYRSALLEHSSTVNWYGVDLYRLTIRVQDMLNSTAYPPNGDYYSEGPMGLLNMTAATGAPGFGSYPHFLLSDPRLLDAIDGLEPNLEEHMTFLDVEPITGLLVTARKQLQTNFFLSKQSFPTSPKNYKHDANEICANMSTLLAELREDPIECGRADALFDILAQEAGWNLNPDTLLDNGIYFPYAYSSEYMTIPEEDATAIKSSVYAVRSAEDACYTWGLISAAFFLCGILAITGTRIYKGETIKQVFCGGGGGEERHRSENTRERKSGGEVGDVRAPLLDVADFGDDVDQERFFDHSDHDMEET